MAKQTGSFGAEIWKNKSEADRMKLPVKPGYDLLDMKQT